MSRFICIEWPTPFSTANVCVSVPAHQRVNSVHARISETMTIPTVHLPPLEVWVTYCGFALATEKKPPGLAREDPTGARLGRDRQGKTGGARGETYERRQKR